MSSPNVRLQLRFDLDLAVPQAIAGLDHGQLCQALATALGATVIQGLPSISAKQLGKAGVTLLGHHHHLDAKSLGGAAVDPKLVIQAAPHLTDEEVAQVAAKAAGKLPAGDASAFLRRLALALVNEYRLVRCVVAALLSNGKPTEIEGDLNLTNGHIFLGEAHRLTKLQANQGGLKVRITGTAIALVAECSGHTLTGPVLDVAVPSLVPHRDALMASWKSR